MHFKHILERKEMEVRGRKGIRNMGGREGGIKDLKLQKQHIKEG